MKESDRKTFQTNEDRPRFAHRPDADWERLRECRRANARLKTERPISSRPEPIAIRETRSGAGQFIAA
jgi:hypothetical protein